MFKTTRAFTSYSVNDIPTAMAFYRDVLGLNTREDKMGVLDITLQDEHHLMLYPKDAHQPATFTVLNFEVENIEKAVDQLSGNGVKFEQYGGDIQTDEKGICRAPGGPFIAWFKDPAGNILSVLESR